MKKKKDIKIAFLASCHEKSQKAIKSLIKKHGDYTPKEADVIVTLGGDGFLLESIHEYIELKKPFFPMNCGSLGYLLNKYNDKNLLKRLNTAESFTLHPLTIEIEQENGEKTTQISLNEASLVRMSRQASHIKISIDEDVKVKNLMSDGVLVATPVGSTAYNFSAGGEVLPLESDLLCLTPICSLHPKRWKGALLHDNSRILFEVLDYDKRPVKAEMDFFELHNIIKMTTYIDKGKNYVLLYDKDAGLKEKILEEQFPS